MTELQQILAKLESIEARLDTLAPPVSQVVVPVSRGGSLAGMDAHQYSEACRNPEIFRAIARERSRRNPKRKVAA